MTNVRTSVHDLHDDAIDLESTLWEIIDGVNTTKISLEYDVEGTLQNPIKYAFIAIVKEAVNNIQNNSNLQKMLPSESVCIPDFTCSRLLTTAPKFPQRIPAESD